MKKTGLLVGFLSVVVLLAVLGLGYFLGRASAPDCQSQAEVSGQTAISRSPEGSVEQRVDRSQVTGKQSLLPDEVKQEIVKDFYRFEPSSKIRGVTIVEITGKGKPLPMDQALGVEEMVCFKVAFEMQEYSNADWVSVVVSGIASRTGNLWHNKGGSWSEGEGEWKRQSCPGVFEEKGLPW